MLPQEPLIDNALSQAADPQAAVAAGLDATLAALRARFDGVPVESIDKRTLLADRAQLLDELATAHEALKSSYGVLRVARAALRVSRDAIANLRLELKAWRIPA